MHSSGPRAKTKRHVSMTKFKTKPRSCTDDERALLCVLQRYFTSGRKENLIVRNRRAVFKAYFSKTFINDKDISEAALAATFKRTWATLSVLQGIPGGIAFPVS